MTNNLVGHTWVRLFVTLILLALVHFALMIPVPGVDVSQVGRLFGRSIMSVIALGLGPFAFGFLVVELLSFVFPIGRRLRRGGVLGRRKLTTCAVSVGVAVALVQATGILFALRNSERVVFADTGLLASLSFVMTLAGGAAFLFAVGKLLSRWGFGNGFCVILAFLLLQNVARSPNSYWLTERSLWIPLEFVVILAAVALLVWKFGQRPTAESGNAGQESVPWLTLPVFVQGVVPVAWAYSAVNLQSSLRILLQAPSLDVEKSFVGLLEIAVLIAAFSIITYHFFSSPKRLARNLPQAVLLPKGEGVSRQSMLKSTALLVILGVALPAAKWFLNFHFSAFALPELVLLVALGFDLVAEWRFRQRHEGRVACVIELDNVYGSSYLQGLLAKNGCDALIRAFHYRSLFFFFEPIFKMELMVPVAELDRAWDLIQREQIQLV